jgi:hypothetical protein
MAEDEHGRYKPPIFPPWSFVERYNQDHYPDPYRTGLDPMVMLAWHQATSWWRSPTPMIRLTGF